MGKLNITIQTAANGVYFTHNGETLVFTDPLLLGDHLFDLALDAESLPDAPELCELYVYGVDMRFAIPQIKMIRNFTGWDLKSSKEACDKARNSGQKVLLLSDLTKERRKIMEKALSDAKNFGYDTIVVNSFIFV